MSWIRPVLLVGLTAPESLGLPGLLLPTQPGFLGWSQCVAAGCSRMWVRAHFVCGVAIVHAALVGLPSPTAWPERAETHEVMALETRGPRSRCRQAPLSAHVWC